MKINIFYNLHTQISDVAVVLLINADVLSRLCNDDLSNITSFRNHLLLHKQTVDVSQTKILHKMLDSERRRATVRQINIIKWTIYISQISPA